MAHIHIGDTVTIDDVEIPAPLGPYIQVTKIDGANAVTVALIADDVTIDRDAIPAGTSVHLQG